MRSRAVLVVVSLLAAAARAEEPTELALGVGTQRLLDVEGLTRFTLDGPAGVVEVKKVGKAQLLLIGDKAGTVALHVWKKSGARRDVRITVHHLDL